MASKTMYNLKFVSFLFLLSFMIAFALYLFDMSVVPIIHGRADLLEWAVLVVHLCSMAAISGIVYVLSRSFLIMFDKGDHYVLFGSFPRLTKKLVLDEHFQITKRQYVYNTGEEETLLRHLVVTDGLHTYRIVMLPVKWIHLIEKREQRVRKRRVDLGEPPVLPPMV
ncbi:MAG: hypothetical protein ACMUHU_07590 [Thermoplasmatota archaeon]